LVVLVQLLYRAGSAPGAQGVKGKGFGSFGSLAYRYPVSIYICVYMYAGSLAYRYPVSLRLLPLLAV